MSAEQLLADSWALLLDFDGPVCSVSAGVPARELATQLRNLLMREGHLKLPDHVAIAVDPFEVFRYAATLGDKEAR